MSCLLGFPTMCEAEKCGYSPAAIADFCFPIVDLGDTRRITLKRAFNTLDEKCGYSPATIADFCFPIVDLGDKGKDHAEESIHTLES